MAGIHHTKFSLLSSRFGNKSSWGYSMMDAACYEAAVVSLLSVPPHSSQPQMLSLLSLERMLPFVTCSSHTDKHNCLWTDIHCLVSCVWSDETHIRAQLLSSFFDGICTFRLSNSVYCDVYFPFLWWCRWTSLIDKLDTAAVWRGSSQWIDACGIACWCKTNKRKRWAWKKRNRCVTDSCFFSPSCCRNSWVAKLLRRL